MRAEAKHGAIGACVALFLTSYVILATKLFSTHSFHDQVAVLVTLIAAGSSSYFFSVVLFRSTLHQLASYPGPWWAAITDWYSVYHCWIGDRHLDFYKLHCKYGNVVRFGPNRISVNSIDALHKIYGATANTQKSQNYNTFHHFFKVPMVATIIDIKKHSSRRRLHSQALSISAIKGLEEFVLPHVRKFCQFLDEKPSGGWSTAKDMTTWMSYLTSDIVNDLTFSRNYNLMGSEENRYIPQAIVQGLGGLNLAGYMPTILTLKVDQLLFPNLNKAKEQFKTLSKAQSDWRLKQDSYELKDLFANLLRIRNSKTSSILTEEELVAEAGILIVAGSDTMATAMAATLFYCLHYPSSLARLQAEIRSAFANVDDIRISEQLDSCKYLRACLNEAMRLSPPVGALLPREVLAGGLFVDDQYFPEGVDIGVPHYSIHHDDLHYPDPFLFKPERWIVNTDPERHDSSKAAVDLAKSAFCAFSVGRAGCIGKTLAYQEMSLIIARVVWLYEMRLRGNAGEGCTSLGKDRERKSEFQTWEGFVSTHKGPMIEFKRRF